MAVGVGGEPARRLSSCSCSQPLAPWPQRTIGAPASGFSLCHSTPVILRSPRKSVNSRGTRPGRDGVEASGAWGRSTSTRTAY